MTAAFGGRLPALAAAAAAALAALLVVAAPLGLLQGLFVLAVLGALLGGIVYLCWHADPAWTLTVGLLLAVFLGNWDRMGVPAAFSPDRIVLLTGIAAVLFRGPGAAFRPKLRFTALHGLLLVAVLYAVGSAAFVGTLTERSSFFVLLDRYGVIPFLVFFVAPAAFHTARQRAVLLAGLVVLGGYLGYLALLSAVGLEHLAFPGYIGNPNAGIHFERARGPFLEAGTMGVALLACGGAALLARTLWRAPGARAAALVVAGLCTVGLLFTLTRQVWLGAVVATIVGMAMLPGARRYIVPVLAGLAVMTAGLLVAVPGLADRAQERREQEGPVYDRYNQTAAALNAIADRPLIGVGWQNYVGRNEEYLEQNPNYPMSGVATAPVHNVPLTYATELGLIGMTMWVAALLFGVVAALSSGGLAAARRWKALFGGVLICYASVMTFQFATPYPNLLVWLLAGVAVAAGRSEAQAERERAEPAVA